MDRGIKKRTSIISKRTDFSDENIDVSVCEESLESLLEEDGTFVEFFNAFLALPMFPIRLYYNADVAYFEEFKHQLADNVMDNDAKKATALQRFSFFKSTIDNKGLKIGYYVKFLSKSDGFNWVKKNRLPLFIKSELCAEYKLARLLSFAQTVYLVNILIDSRNLEKNAFDERSSPQYRTHRTRGKLPGLAEFQERMQLLQEDKESQNCEASIGSCSESNDSDLEEVEFSQMYSRRRNKSSAFEIPQSSDDNRSNKDKSDSIQAINETETNVGRDVSIVIKTSLDGENCTDDPTRSDFFAKENKTVELVKEDTQNTKWDVRKPEEDFKDGQVSKDAGNVFSLQDSGILTVAVALKRTYEEATGLTLQSEETSSCENNQLDNEKTNDFEFQLEDRADENEAVNEDREVTVVAQVVPLGEHIVHSDHASQSSTDSQQEITQLTDEVKSVVNTCNCKDNSQSASTSQFQCIAEASILSVEDDTIVEENYQKKIEDIDEIRPDLELSDSAYKLEKHLDSTKEAEICKDDDEQQGRDNVCPTRNDLKCDEENEKINLNPIIEGDDDDDDLGERMKVTVTTSNTDSGLADDLEFMSIDDPERVSLGINGVIEGDPQSVNAPFISIEGPMGESVRCSSTFSDYSRDGNAETNQEKESFANNDPFDIHPRVQDNIDNLQRIESDKNYLVSNKPSRRGSDLSTMGKNSKNDELLEHQSPRRQSMPLLTRKDLRRRLSSVSNASDALDAMNDLLANDMIDIRKRTNQTAISVLYEESDSDDDSGGDNSSTCAKKPIDVASKSGMDAFKYFLVDTPGEKLMLLWVEIERLKYCSDKEKLRIVQEIRQRFFRSGAPFELSVGTLKKWKIKGSHWTRVLFLCS